MKILMVASENDALAGAKVGGIGDVVRDVPPILAQRGHQIKVVIPAYGFLHKTSGSRVLGPLSYKFAGEKDDASVLYEVPGRNEHAGVTHYVIDHPDFISTDRHKRPEIYHTDTHSRPFATDATKYARFCMAVAEALKQENFGPVDCIHLHDWHAALVLVLRQYHPAYSCLQKVRSVYTIHNLALQGVRPLKNDNSSLQGWYPNLKFERKTLVDPRWTDCVNPTMAGITLSDAVHTVSPSYAEEIVEPSDKPRYYGGEGLHEYLSTAQSEHRLVGILNGCDYPEQRTARKMNFAELWNTLTSQVIQWAGRERDSLSPAHFVAYTRLTELSASMRRPQIVLTSVARIGEQKCLLMKQSGSRYESGLEGILKGLGNKGIYIVLGTGAADYEQFFTEMSTKYANLLFLKGFSTECADTLYGNGDLFLMPSSFEPCGISQMMAMRDGQPCVVHHVGGLKDTIENGVTGFGFTGDTVEAQVDAFIETSMNAIRTKLRHAAEWKRICTNAAAMRFLWSDAVDKYIERLYQPEKLP